MLKLMQKFLRADDGATAIEYAMIVSMIFIAIVGAVQALGQGIMDTLYNKLSTAL